MRMFWKRFAGLATDYGLKYRYEPFFQTEINVLGLQLVFGLLILIIVALSFSFLYQDIIDVLTRGIQASQTAVIPTETIGASITAQLEYLRTRNVTLIITSIVIATVCFGYIIARITLSPVRNALESQKRFIGNVAHELRTPLSTIKTNTEVALFEKSMAREMRQMLESNIEELDRISDIINNLLSLSASVRPERIEFSRVNLAEIIDTVVKKMHKLAERKQLEITIRFSEGRAVWGNATALEQIVSNILKNAIIFTQPKGHVGITVEQIGGNIELTIQDSGTGIPREDLFHIFEPFYRADRSRNRARGGSGLGLTIVSELVKLHGGRITVRSAEGRGTTVVVLLPADTEIKQTATSTKQTDEVAIDFSSKSVRT